MTTYDKRDPRGWKNVKHGSSAPHPRVPTMSLEEAKALGLHIGPELIISPTQNDSPRRPRGK